MLRFVVSILVACSLVACSSEPRPSPSSHTAPPERIAPPTAAPAPEPPPLAVAREVRIEASDGVVLVGDLREGASPDAPLVVLVHQLGSTRAEWEPLLRWLGAAPAITTFAFDMRGHGASTTRAHAAEVHYASFTTADWERAARDVRTVLTHLRERENLHPRSVALIGSSIGSSAVILAATEEPSVAAIVALSPGRAYRGLDTITPLAQLGDRPLLAVASRGEPPSAETASDMGRIASGGEALLVDGDRHGVAMFESAPESLVRVREFLRQHLGAEAP